MQADGESIRLSATDLANHLGCRYLTGLDYAAARKTLEPPIWQDPVLDVLRERGERHEAQFAAHLVELGRTVVEIGRDAGVAGTREKMTEGVDVLFQAPLEAAGFRGIADFLVRVDAPSDLGDFSYEVLDTKLAQETRAGTILQLSLYSELVAGMQGCWPERMHVVKPGEGFPRDSYRCADFQAYYRLVQNRLVAAVDDRTGDVETYPTPVPQCDICRWWQHCDARRRKDDNLCLVAGMTTMHTRELEGQGVRTLAQLGESDAALAKPPARGNAATYERLRAQAKIQLEGRRAGEPRFKLLDLEDGRGLARLPVPSPGDVFFDIEGDAFVEGGGLEYLLGWSVIEDGSLVYESRWALDRTSEKRAFEEFLDTVMARLDADPGMHVYHFAPYEPSAAKRLMGRHGTREAQVDRLLRGGRFVDLHAVARQGVRASVERYGLKQLEPFFEFERDVDLREEASPALRRVERALELTTTAAARAEEIRDEDRNAVEGYNREDCEATEALRGWLEGLRQEWIDRGAEIARPDLAAGDASEAVEERHAEVQEVYDALTDGLPEAREDWDEEQCARGLLAEMLEYHRREMKCAYWEFFRMLELDFDGALAERKAIAGLSFEGEVDGGTVKCPVHRYSFPEQEAAVDEDDALRVVGGGKLGTVWDIDQAGRTIDVKKREDSTHVHATEVFVDAHVPQKPKDRSLLSFARSVAADGIDGDGPFRAGRDLLLKRPPRRVQATGGALRTEGEPLVEAAVRIVNEMDGGLLPVQGPPGSGKTFIGARMIFDLVKQQKRVGVTAVSHKVIRNLLEKTLSAARQDLTLICGTHKIGDKDDSMGGAVTEVTDNGEALRSLDLNHVVGGTAWLWSRDDAVETLDYLFVDEAGQMAIADVLAVSRAARNVVLLGDPQQLEQPQQGSHPEGTEVAALVHVLDGRDTIAEDKGLFFDETWRLHPSICEFTSEIYYEGKLQSHEGLERQVLGGPTRYQGSGLFVVPVDHEGNQSSSPEEVDAVARVADDLLRGDVTWTDKDGITKPLGPDDVLVVAPYNAQIAALKRRLPHLHIGTVDKFQGQQAPVVIYSMTSSSPEDAPRGMSFLYNPNRLNVATSRARCACVLVASSELFAPECRTPEQMRWANGLCRFRELAEDITL